MFVPQSIADIEQMIRDEVQENIHLDYKDSRAIRHDARDDIAKDVSAFANSDGGVLIYGVREKDHIPFEIADGVEDAKFSREWIEAAVLTGITPRLDDVRIIPITRSPGHSLYVVEIAKTFRGPHQASDKRYYKRHNFKSVPMEDYELADLRGRRERVQPLITFQIGEWRRFVAAFDVSNISDTVAEDVTFDFPEELPWTDRGKPHLFQHGIRKFPPHQQFRFLYFTFPEILQGKKGVPDEFIVRISYYHAQAGSRVTDEWPVNFRAYEDSTAVRPEIEEQIKDIAENIKKLGERVEALNRMLKNFQPLAGNTGLDLSISSLRNIRRAIAGQNPEPLNPQGCDPGIFREVLGVDLQMAWHIWRAIGDNCDPDRLRSVPGMSDELMMKIREAFVIKAEEDATSAPDQDVDSPPNVL